MQNPLFIDGEGQSRLSSATAGAAFDGDFTSLASEVGLGGVAPVAQHMFSSHYERGGSCGGFGFGFKVSLVG